MKRPLIAILFTLTFSLIIIALMPGRPTLPGSPPLEISVSDQPTPTMTATLRATSTPKATVMPEPTAPAAAAPPPRIIQTHPVSPVLSNRRQPFQINFNQAMDPDAVAAALTISPTLPYDLIWDNPFTLTIVPLTPLAPGRRYQFTLGREAVNEQGIGLNQPHTLNYSLRPLISNLYLNQPSRNASGHSTPQHLRITFAYDMDQKLVAAAIHFDPPLPGELTWADGRTARYDLSQPPALDTTYTLTFNQELQDSQGEPIALNEPYTFTTPSGLVSHSPRSRQTNVNPLLPLNLTFDRPLAAADLAQTITITPAIAGNFTISQTIITFTPNDGYFAPTTSYQVSIAPTLTGEDGVRLLAQPYQFNFTTSRLQQTFNFGYGPRVQLVDSQGRRAIQFQSPIPITNVNLDFYPLTQNQFISRLTNLPEWGWYEDWAIAHDDLTLSRTQAITQVATIEAHSGLIGELLLPDDLPVGLYLLNLRSGYVQDQILLIISQNSVVAKQGMRQMTAWVTNINDQPAAEAEVEILAQDGQLIASGRTNNLGIYKTSLDPAGPAPYLVLARQGDDTVLTALQWNWQSYVTGSYFWSLADSTLPYASTIYTDRPIYRPGHTVYYKAIIRSDEDAILSMVAAGTPINVRISDARNNTVQRETLLTNDFGTINGSFTLADGAMLGEYYLTISLGEYNKRQMFKVEDYRKPEYELTLTTDSTAYIAGDTVTLQFAAAYYFGEPVANANATLKIFEGNTGYAYYEGYTHRSWSESYNPNPPRTQTAADGTAQFTWRSPLSESGSEAIWDGNLRWRTFGLEVTIDDGSGQPVSSMAVIRVYNRQAFIRLLSANRFVYAPGDSITLQAEMLTIEEEPVSGRALTVELSQYSRSSYRYEVIRSFNGAVTDSRGRATLTLSIDTPGYYRLTVRGQDAQGRAIHVERWLYIYRPGVSNWAETLTAITIHADADSYAPGDIAQLTIESGWAGPALLTFERATTRREMMITLTPPLTIVDIPIQADDVPNIFVTVNAWRPQDTHLVEDMYTSKPDSQLAQTTLNLSIPPTAQTLNVTIIPDREVAGPNQELSVAVRVTNQQGVPVSAELSLAMVDEAIFALSQDLSGPLLQAFYFPRRKAITTYDAFRPVRYLWGGGMGGGGGGDGWFGDTPRSDFRDTAYWFPALTTDANGEVTVTLILPDNLTSWRFTARAVTADTQVGETYINIITRQDVVVRPQLPRILTTGDTVHLSALVQNFSGESQTFTVGVLIPQPQPEAGSPISFTSPITQVITLAPGATRIVGWQAEAIGLGSAELIFYAENQSEGPGDAIALSVPVRPLALPDVTALVGQFTSSATNVILWPDGALPNSTVRVELSRSIAGSMLNGLEYLTGFPYGCVEQTMSRALPTAVVARAFNQLGVSTPELEADLTSKIEASIQRLYGLQHDDGGWGWWYDDDSQAYQTAWVLFGLATIADAGYMVDAAVIQRAADWLNDHITQMDNQTRAYALYSLAIAGHGNAAATTLLAAQAHNLDSFNQAAVALALWELGEPAKAREVMALLEEQAVQSGNRVYWSGRSRDGSYDYKLMASDTRTTALILSALARIQPGSSLEIGAVRWLMAQRGANGWGNTNETSFAILGLTDHLLAARAAGGESGTSYVIELNGAVYQQGEIAADRLAVTVDLPAEALTAGSNQLRLSHSGSGLLYYTIVARTYTAETDIAAAGPVVVTRRYVDPISKQPIENPSIGALVEVILTYTLMERHFYLLLEDHLPGGLEPINERLNTSSHEGQGWPYGTPRTYWQTYQYNQKEIYGDRITFFITSAGPGPHTITYLARVTQSGQFTALPAELSAMYDATTWGRSGSAALLFTERE